MKAIQIFDVNRELLDAWGAAELTWENDFSDFVGDVLVIDDKLPQGFAFMPASIFLDTYRWTTNFGTKGWSEIKRISDMNVADESEPESIYIVWDMNADSWSGITTMKSIHKTLEGAIQAIPETIKKDDLKRPLKEPYVANYTYYAVEKRSLKD